MKRIYWRPKQISPRALGLIAGAAAIALVVVESFRVHQVQPWQQEKLEAAQLAKRGFEVVRDARLRNTKELDIDPTIDPGRSGLIGFAATPVTSSRGGYLSKRTSINPNFAGAIVQMLKRAEVEKGDLVAVALSGSFPALNICTFAAIETLGLRPIVISSAASSEWGANDPDYLWLDMETELRNAGVFKIRSMAATIGGMEDKGMGLPEASISLLKRGIERNEVPFLDPKSLEDSAKKRLALYKEKAGNKPFVAYINVGGGQGSTGGYELKETYLPGLNLKGPAGVDPKYSVMGAFSKRDVPVIHLIHVQDLARKYQLPQSPNEVPEPGQGGVFERVSYNRFLAGFCLVLVVGVLTVFVRTHWGAQFLRPHAAKADSGDIEPMI